MIFALHKKKQSILEIENILVFPKTLEQHLKRIEEALRLTQDANMTIQWKKVFLFSKAIDLLGHVIGLESHK